MRLCARSQTRIDDDVKIERKRFGTGTKSLHMIQLVLIIYTSGDEKSHLSNKRNRVQAVSRTQSQTLFLRSNLSRCCNVYSKSNFSSTRLLKARHNVSLLLDKLLDDYNHNLRPDIGGRIFC